MEEWDESQPEQHQLRCSRLAPELFWQSGPPAGSDMDGDMYNNMYNMYNNMYMYNMYM